MSWARATLIRGASGGSIWQVDATYPQARVTVGSAPNAGWVVQGPGIAPVHVELYWDGNALYVADPQGAGDVRLNGQPVREWAQVRGRGQLVFGHAIMDLETAVAEPTNMVRDPGTAPRISAPLVGDATRVADQGELENEATRVATAPSEMAGAPASMRPPAPPSLRPPAPPPGRPGAPPPAPGRPGAPPAPPGMAPPGMAPPGPGGERPRLGGSPQTGFREEARTLIGTELKQEATRMVDQDLLSGGAPFAPPGSVPTSPGLEAPPAYGAPMPGMPPGPVPLGMAPMPGMPMGPPGMGMAPGMMGPPGMAPGMAPPGMAPGMAPPGMAPGMAPPGMAPGMGPPGMAPGMGPPGMAPGMGPGGPPGPAMSGGFVAPPAYNATQQLRAQSSKGGGVPARTWVMAVVLVGAVVGTLFLIPVDETPAPGTTGTGTTGTAAGAAGAAASAVPAGTDGGVDAGRPVFVNPSTFQPVLTIEMPDGGVPRTPDSVAAQLVIDGHLEDALVQYEALHQAHPEQPEYGIMVEVLHRELETRCLNGRRWDGSSCQ